jgi:hypothetical protein
MGTISFTKDDDYSSRKAAIARQEKLAEMLSQMGAQEQAVSTAGGIAAPISGMGALARGLTSFGGAYMSGKAARDAAALDKGEKASVEAERARIFGMTPAVAATPLSQGAYQGVDAEGIPSYDVNLPTPAKAASYILPPEEQIDALNALSGRSSFGERAATIGMPLAARRLERADAQTDLVAKQAYDAGIRGQARAIELKDKTKRSLTAQEVSDRGLRPGTPASIDGFGNVTIDQDLDTL